jgi:hypothetical protein
MTTAGFRANLSVLKPLYRTRNRNNIDGCLRTRPIARIGFGDVASFRWGNGKNFVNVFGGVFRFRNFKTA